MAAPELISTALVKPKVNIAALNTTDDAAITELIHQASGRFEDECKQPIAVVTDTYEFSGQGGTIFTLPFWPVTILAKLEVCEGLGADWIEIDAAGYKLTRRGDAYSILYPTGFADAIGYRVNAGSGGIGYPLMAQIATPIGLANVTRYRATITHGYADDAIPYRIQEVVRDEVVAQWYERGDKRDRFDVKSVAVTEKDAYQGKVLTLDSEQRERKWDRAVRRYRRRW